MSGSPSSLPQSSTGRFDVIGVRLPVLGVHRGQAAYGIAKRELLEYPGMSDRHLVPLHGFVTCVAGTWTSGWAVNLSSETGTSQLRQDTA